MFTVLLALNWALSLFGCSGTSAVGGSGSSILQAYGSNEAKGVPKKQLEVEIYPSSSTRNYTVTKCTHNVDTALHRDTIQIEYCASYKYMRTDYVQSYVYQYNKETDIWTQMSKGKLSYNSTILDSLKNTKWSGTTNTGFGYFVNYSITVDAINTIDGWIKFSYDIYFAEKTYAGTEYMEYGAYSLSHVENMFTVTFDPDDGFCVYG